MEKLKIFVNKVEVLEYDFSFLGKYSLESISGRICIEMNNIGCHLPLVSPRPSIIIGTAGIGHLCVDDKSIYFDSETDVDADCIKTILDAVKHDYLEIVG